MLSVAEAACPTFARHETFHPRYGWFLKGVMASLRAPDAFRVDSAPVDLGVGKNMVRAIRFWCRAAKLLAEVENPSRPRLPLITPTKNAVALFDEAEGMDRYLELSGSLWLLHWWMMTPPTMLPVWWIALNEFGAVEFSADDLAEAVAHTAGEAAEWAEPSTSAIDKDTDCFLRMYAGRELRGRQQVDDQIDAPFRELGLIEPVYGVQGRYRFVLGAKPSLPDELVVYACLDHLRRADTSARVISIQRLAQDPGGPGRVFKLTRDALVAALEHYGSDHGQTLLTNAAGVVQLVVEGDPMSEALLALRRYYDSLGHVVPRTLELGDEAWTGATPMQLSTKERARKAAGAEA